MKTSKIALLGAWSGLIYIVLIGIAWIFLMRIVPAHQPTLGAAEVAALYAKHSMGIKLGVVLLLLSCFFLGLYGSVLTKLMEKVEGSFGVLSLNTLITSIMGMVITMMAAVFWGVAAFRADRAAELVQTINDLAWLTFFSTAPPLFGLFVCTAVAALLMDKNKQLGIFPKWYGYLNLWVLIAIIPGPLCFLFKTGPFAWNGLIVFWFAFVVFGACFILSPKVVVPAVKQHWVD